MVVKIAVKIYLSTLITKIVYLRGSHVGFVGHWLKPRPHRSNTQVTHLPSSGENMLPVFLNITFIISTSF